MSDSTDTTPVIDRKELLARLDDDTELLAELVDLFLEDLPARMQGMREALAEDDVERLHELAHALKGSVGNLAATRAMAAATTLNKLARAGEREGLKEAVDRFEADLQQLEPALRELVASF